jgi:predicted  nucleic acid-binding Zn-ribbon protein
MKREHSGSYDPSERSGASYVKVSHSKKIRDLERQIEELMDREKTYKAQIENYLKNINQLNKEVESVRGAVHNYGSEKSMKGKASDVKSKENKESQVFIEDDRLKNYAN